MPRTSLFLCRGIAIGLVAGLPCTFALFAFARFGHSRVAAETRDKQIVLAESQETRQTPISFAVQNRGTRALRILDIQRSCACTDTQLSARVVPPGEEATLTANVTISPFDREKHIACVLVTDDPHESLKRFTATLSIIPRLQFAKDSHDLGSLAVNSRATSELELVASSTTGAPSTVSIEGSIPALTAEVGEWREHHLFKKRQRGVRPFGSVLRLMPNAWTRLWRCGLWLS